MSEYQRYEFMTSDRPLTATQLAEVRTLSSHIEASPSFAWVEYSWGDFKHDPLDVLYRYFDGFLYFANWGAHRLGLRFPHGVLSADLLAGYDLDDVLTFTRHDDYDLLDIHFDEIEAPDEWVEYELGPLMPLREELMDGDLRALYIIWLGARQMALHPARSWSWRAPHDDNNDALENEDADDAPPVRAGLAALTGAQRALGDLLRLPAELLRASAQHSPRATPPTADDVDAWLDLLPATRQRDYLLRLARNEPGISHQLIRDLRALRPDASNVSAAAGARVAFAQLLAESRAIKEQMERERLERERKARERHLHDIHSNQDFYWSRATAAVERGSGPGYDEATKDLVELRAAAQRFDEADQFDEAFRAWFPAHARRRAFVKRLVDEGFSLPEE